jgi:uncharacterized protein (TIGR02145 family)
MKNEGTKFRYLFAALTILIFSSCIKEFLEYFNENNNGSGPVSGIRDADGNLYSTVKIGEQTWMVENLKTTKFNDGTPVSYFSQGSGVNPPAYCWYKDNLTHKNPYGALYNYYAVASGILAPKGWHIPDKDEINYMLEVAGDVKNIVESGSDHWVNNRPEATNQTGFSALPGGGKITYSDGSYSEGMGVRAYFWELRDPSDNLHKKVIITINTSGSPQPYNSTTAVIDPASLLSVRCLKDDVPILSTSPVSGIWVTTAQTNVTVKTTGGFPILSQGICWSTSANPTVEKDQKTVSYNKTKSGEIVYNMTGLQSNTTYYVRAYATNKMGIGYGNEVTFVTESPSTEAVTDVDGNVYHTVKIGGLIWLAENLKVIHYNDGTPINYRPESFKVPNPPYKFENISSTLGLYAWYNNEASMKDTYGALYDYNAALCGKLAPQGWHVSTYSDWEELVTVLGGVPPDGGQVERKIRETGNEHWINSLPGVTNETGFTALPAGMCTDYNYQEEHHFSGLGTLAGWWTSTWLEGGYSGGLPDGDPLYSISFNYLKWHTDGYHYFSIRCVKDGVPLVSTIPVTEVTSSMAKSGGKIRTDGGLTIKSAGVCWNTSPNPTIDNFKTVDPVIKPAPGMPLTGLGPFNSNITGLQSGKTYYVRAYAVNELGIGYGQEISFKTN